MKVAILGHSYVRDLSRLGHQTITLDDNSVAEVAYFAFPGAKYVTFLNDPDLLTEAFAYRPDFFIIILAGNSFSVYNTNSEVYDQCTQFYERVKQNCPTSVIVAAQAELRFNNSSFRHLPCVEYAKRRNAFNRFIKKFKLKDFILQVAGSGRLDNECFYRDNIHLNNVGLSKYFEYIVKTLNYCHTLLS